MSSYALLVPPTALLRGPPVATRVFTQPEAAELLECPVCADVFGRLTKEPRVLACGHTCCAGCLARAGVPFACPLCRARVTEAAPPRPVFLLTTVADALRVHCRNGLTQDGAGAWVVDPSRCDATPSQDALLSNEAVCDWAVVCCAAPCCADRFFRRDSPKHAEWHAHGKGEWKHTLDAALLRILKSRRRVPHAALLTEAALLVAPWFAAPRELVEKRITDLVSLEYMHRLNERAGVVYTYWD